MKKLSAAGSLLALSIMMSACGATARTPAQVLQAASTKTGSIQTMKVDMEMSISSSISAATLQCGPGNELPPALAVSLGEQFNKMTPAEKAQACAQLAASRSQVPSSVSMTMSGSGAFKVPDAMSMSMSISVNGTSIKTDMVLLGGKIYTKNPLSGAWTSMDNPAQLDTSGLNQLNPAASVATLSAAKSVTDLGDTSLGDVRVHHYRVVLDPAKLQAAIANKPIFKNPNMQKLVQQYSSVYGASTTTVEVWIGVNDDLVRRYSMNLAPDPGASTSGAASPMSNMKMKMTMNMHDFGVKVDIKAPPVSQ